MTVQDPTAFIAAMGARERPVGEELEFVEGPARIRPIARQSDPLTPHEAARGLNDHERLVQ